MNSTITDHRAYEQDNRARYRELLISSQQRQAKVAPYHYDFHGEPATWLECLELTLFAAAMLAGMALAIMWGLK